MTRPLLVTSGLLGIVAGLRSQLPNAALAARGLGATSGPLAVLGSAAGRRAAYLAALGEMVADKLPATPSRVQRGPLLGRVASGGLAGAAVFASTGDRGRALLVPALAGAAGAFVGTWGGYLARRQVVAATGLPDPAVAVAEDALAVGLAALALRARS